MLIAKNVNGKIIKIDTGKILGISEKFRFFVSQDINAITQASIKLKLTVGSIVSVNWGNDDITVIVGDGLEHTYLSSYTE